MREEKFGSYKWTVVMTGLLLWAFKFEVILANHFTAGNIQKLLIDGPVLVQIATVFSSGFLHQKASYVLGNLLWFIPLSAIIEQQESKVRYLLLVLLVPFLANMILPTLLGITPAVGASSLVRSFATYGLVRQMQIYGPEDINIYTSSQILFCVLAVSYFIVTLPTEGPGTSTTAHLFGLILGGIAAVLVSRSGLNYEMTLFKKGW